MTQTAPCIIQIGIAGVESAQFLVACEQEVLWESKSLKDAIIDLYAAYYVFDIAYPTGGLGVFIFPAFCF